eukprot:Selendium_serpulae@DN5863_c0_g2_i1.p1
MRRLNTIAGHLAPEQSGDPSNKQSLSVVDNRTGSSYIIPIKHNSIKATDLSRIKLGPSGSTDAVSEDKGVKAFDPGFMNTACCVSRVSFIDGSRGILRYRGYPIEQLATEGGSFEETVFLLLYGDLPTRAQLSDFSAKLRRSLSVPEGVKDIIRSFSRDVHPMAMLMTAMVAVGGYRQETNPVFQGQDVYKDGATRNWEALRAIGATAAAAAFVLRHRQGLPFVEPARDVPFIEAFLMMLDGAQTRPHSAFVRALEVLFITHAEHELNCSTAAARHLASSNADIYTSFAGAVGALYGPRHGGANEAVVNMLQRIRTVDQVPKFMGRVKARDERLMGFGHRIYKSYDPRVRIVRQVAEEVFQITGADELIEVAKALEHTAVNDEFFIKRKLYPNVDFYSGLIYKALGFPSDYFTVLFAVPRAAGWAAHWMEFQVDPDNRISRPLQVYRGKGMRTVVPIEERPQAVPAQALTVRVPIE